MLPDIQYFLEEQAVSGRWRALTRAHTRPSTETWRLELYSILQSISIIASWGPRSIENEDSYGNRLPSIFKAINELRIAIGENFTSSDLDICVFKCDKIFDPAFMEDAYDGRRDGRRSRGKRASEPIIGTTGIGLGKVKAERSAKNGIRVQMQTLIPAKVVIWSPTVIKALGLQKKRDGHNQAGRD